jgi:aspartate kinase
MKFGGTSLGSPARIKRVARLIVNRKREDVRPIVVVSAMGDSTDRLTELATKVTRAPGGRELDMLLTAGERISMALLAMAIRDLGEEALSFTGSQIGLITDTRHNRARIIEIRAFRLTEALESGKIPIVAGFQGVSLDKDVTTLGRGGSDLTAVALARVLGNVACEIYTDVPGVFGCDPHRFRGAKRWDTISYNEMLELSDCGAQVVHPRAVALAARGNLPVRVLSGLRGGGGSVIKDEKLDEPRITGVTQDDVVLFRVILQRRTQIEHWPVKLAGAGVQVKFLSYNPSNEGRDCTLAVAKEDEDLAVEVLDEALGGLPNARWEREESMVQISLVGYGVGESPSIVEEFLEVFEGVKAPLRALQVSGLRVSAITRKRHAGPVVKGLAKKYELVR